MFEHKRTHFFAFVYVSFAVWNATVSNLKHKLFLFFLNNDRFLTRKKRLLTSFVALVSFENLHKLLFYEFGMFYIKIDKTCASKQDIIWQFIQQENRSAFRSNYCRIFHLNGFRFQQQTSRIQLYRKQLNPLKIIDSNSAVW